MQFEQANRLFHRLYQCSNLLHKNGTRSLEAYGVTTQQWAVIGALARPAVREKGGLPVKELIDYLMLSRQNLAPVLERLEARGWISRLRSQRDGRSRLLHLTGAGEAVWQEMQAPIAAFYARALADLGTADAGELNRLLDALRSGLARA